MRTIFFSAVVLGAVLVVVSFFWPTLVGGKRHWSPEQANQYQIAAGNLHCLTFEVENAKELVKQTPDGQKRFADSKLADATASKTPVDPIAATPDRMANEYAKAKQEYERQKDALDAARSYGEGVALAMRWIGALLSAGGVGGLLFFGHSETR